MVSSAIYMLSTSPKTPRLEPPHRVQRFVVPPLPATQRRRPVLAEPDAFEITPQARVQAQTTGMKAPTDRPPAVLTTIRGGRHDGYASIVLQFSEYAEIQGPLIVGDEIHLTLARVESAQPAYRRYKNFASWLALKSTAGRTAVRIGRPAALTHMTSYWLTNPYRFVINLYDRKPSAPPAAKAPSPAPQTAQEKPAFKPRKPRVAALEAPPPVTDPVLSTLSAPGDRRQQALIRARILSRQGHYPQSLRLYRQLRQQFPADTEIWEDYVETLTHYRAYERALSESQALLGRFPNSLRGQRIQALIYQELRLPHWTYPIYENILQQYRHDAGIWSDYAYARFDAGDWSAALNYFGQVLEIDPSNASALQSVHTILKEHRPRLALTYDRYTTPADDLARDTYQMHYSRHAGTDTRLAIDLQRIEVHRPAQGALASLDRTIETLNVRIGHGLDTHWQINLGAGIHSGIDNDSTHWGQLNYSGFNQTLLQAEYLYRSPWIDPVEALDDDGHFDRWRMSLNWTLNRNWAIFTEAAYWNYALSSRSDYGRRHTVTGIITRRLFERPNLSVGYSYFHSRFTFADDTFTPVDMLTAEDAHAISLDYELRPCEYWAYGLSGGYRWDTARAIGSWFVQPAVKARLGNRIELGLTYDYASESGTATGGETQNIRINSNVIF